MFNISAFIDLPLVFVGVIALAIFLYVLLDGFDLGVGILFPFAPSDECRSKMMNSVAPFWDGNETWLVMGGSALFAAFPIAYSIIMPALYIPITLMLLGLILRGVAFEFRFKTTSKNEQKIWDYSFHFGSLIATFFQGVMLGCFVSGLECCVKNYLGWFNGFALMTGVALIFGYALIGSTWLIMKTHGRTHDWARQSAFYALVFVGFFILLVSAWTPLLNQKILFRWFSLPNIFYLSPIPLLTLLTFFFLIKALLNKKEVQPFVLTILLFTLCYFGIAVTLFPYVLPYEVPFSKVAAAPESLSFLFVGLVVTLPVILVYTIYSYYIFRGKSSHERMY
ncbi:MAG: cytochrome d ubiquinol oxidase subunit II [Proteobacteria bacterium]|nr:cytochrome d ubiquinol oxidase subunit II [Pseudomonadota bacterium]